MLLQAEKWILASPEKLGKKGRNMKETKAEYGSQMGFGASFPILGPFLNPAEIVQMNFLEDCNLLK